MEGTTGKEKDMERMTITKADMEEIMRTNGQRQKRRAGGSMKVGHQKQAHGPVGEEAAPGELIICTETLKSAARDDMQHRAYE